MIASKFSCKFSFIFANEATDFFDLDFQLNWMSEAQLLSYSAFLYTSNFASNHNFCQNHLMDNWKWIFLYVLQQFENMF